MINELAASGSTKMRKDLPSPVTSFVGTVPLTAEASTPFCSLEPHATALGRHRTADTREKRFGITFEATMSCVSWNRQKSDVTTIRRLSQFPAPIGAVPHDRPLALFLLSSRQAHSLAPPLFFSSPPCFTLIVTRRQGHSNPRPNSKKDTLNLSRG